ncbi:DUF3800 domain-containing protein [Candidatus Saccharibacteria bacterium SW_7_54_9]|nr:MAG: DUF3800 domain-containing protein [Candidatus Saccharibacteria bacterium SW_7_54_9]
MSSFDDYIVYVDESGDHGLSSINPQYPVFVLAFCLFNKRTYAERITSRITDLKFKYFGHDQVVLHERDIRKRNSPFNILLNPNTRSEFMEDVSQIVREAPFTLIASAIDKRELKSQYDDPANPYHLALAFGLERLYYHLNGDKNCEDGTLHIVFEERGKREDDNLELEFRRVIDNNRTGDRLPFDIVFSNKQSNAAGLQLADLVARPIGRHLLKPKQQNRAYDVIKEKFRQSPEGKTRGWGLKVFP